MAEPKYCETCNHCWDSSGKLPGDSMPTLGKKRETCPWCKADPDGLSRIKIEKNIPVPSQRVSDYTFLPEMKKGDSILLPNPEKKLKDRVLSAAYGYGRKHNKKFIGRTVDEGVRIWRIK